MNAQRNSHAIALSLLFAIGGSELGQWMHRT